MRKDVAAAAGITEKSSFADRAKALNGKTIGIQGVGSIVHAWERLVASRGGLDVEKDVRIAPMDPPAMLPALGEQGDRRLRDVAAVHHASGEQGRGHHAGERRRRMRPTSFRLPTDLVQTKPETCQQNREKCVRIVRALANANKMIIERPAEALELLKKRFAHNGSGICWPPHGKSS